ncbi:MULTISPECIES: LPS export ABC transporter permease LptF [unclassified Rhodosalinus]|uniref:LPS export ABC transporter permease LptF n=1 Tax=unclassified Rhodosalinus TaxID=2630183 RepID=UPI003523E5B9
MARFDRYMLSQLMVLFGFFALVLVSVYWVNQAVQLFDRLIAAGHSATVVLEFTLLSLPKVVGQVMPLSAFAAAVYVTNRLSNESELTVVQATGYSPWRLARPVAVYGLILAAMTAALSHVLIPASGAQFAQREAEIAESLSAKLFREGVFLNPSEGVTFYIREITPAGELRDVYLSDRRRADRPVTYTAERAFLLREDAATRLVMVDGMAQTLFRADRRLSTTSFDELAYDVSSLVAARGPPRPNVRTLSTLALLGDPGRAAGITGQDVGRVLQEAHLRFTEPLLVAVAALIGFSTLVAGGFSRLGMGRRIALAIFLLVLVEVAKGAVVTPVRNNPALWPAVYLPAALGFAISAWMLWQAARPRRRRRVRAPDPAEGAAA